MVYVKSWLKKFTIRFLLVAYSLFVLKPVMPIIMDDLAHAFWKNVHIAVVHKINGKEHVHYEMYRAASDLRKEKGAGRHKAETEASPHLAVTPHQVLCFQLPCQLQEYITCDCQYAGSDPEMDYPPPRG